MTTCMSIQELMYSLGVSVLLCTFKKREFLPLLCAFFQDDFLSKNPINTGALCAIQDEISMLGTTLGLDASSNGN